jgi:hypothetical protein
MYGLVNKALKSMVLTHHGEETWQKILQQAQLENPVFISTESYPDHLTYALVGGAAEVLTQAVPELLEAFGYFWATHTAVIEYPELMARGGSTLKDFLRNLPNFHTHVTLMLPRLEPPDFVFEESGADSILMHYHSNREGLAPFAYGIFKGLGKVFEENVEVTQVAHKHEGADHDIFKVTWSQIPTA